MLLTLLFSFAMAEPKTIAIKGMDCKACVSAINKAVCAEKEMQTWFNKCESKVKNAKEKMGELTFETAANVTIDAEKMKKN